MSRRAVILAGGKGTRLRPFTIAFPKPLMPVGDYPILEVVVRQLACAGFARITMAVNHQADLIRAFFGNGKKWNINIDYSLEDEPLGTMGPLRLIKDLPDNFLVMNGDVLTDLDFRAFFDDHVASQNQFTISSYRRTHKVDYGVLGSDNRGRLTEFREKPETAYEVSMGIYMVSRAVLEAIPPGQPFGFDSLMLKMLRNQKPVHVCPFRGYWLDIGRPDDYALAVEEFEGMKARLLDA